MNLSATGYTDLAVNLHARSKSSVQGVCNSVTGIYRSTEDMII